MTGNQQTMAITVLEIAFDSEEYRQTVQLRDEVLRRPLGLTFSAEQLAAEGSDIHLAVMENESVIACAILTPMNEHRIKMRQVAVSPDKQGTGIGKRLVEYCEKAAIRRGFTEMFLHARAAVVPFYEKSGYCTVGEGFVEVGIPHRAMMKNIS